MADLYGISSTDQQREPCFQAVSGKRVRSVQRRCMNLTRTRLYQLNWPHHKPVDSVDLAPAGGADVDSVPKD